MAVSGAKTWIDLRAFRRVSKRATESGLLERLKELSFERRRFGYSSGAKACM